MTRTMVLGAMATWICLAMALVALSYLPIGVWAQPTLDSAAGRVFGPLSPRLPPPDLAPAVWHKAIRSWLKPPAPNWDGTEWCHPLPSQLSEKLDLLRIFGPIFGPLLSQTLVPSCPRPAACCFSAWFHSTMQPSYPPAFAYKGAWPQLKPSILWRPTHHCSAPTYFSSCPHHSPTLASC